MWRIENRRAQPCPAWRFDEPRDDYQIVHSEKVKMARITDSRVTTPMFWTAFAIIGLLLALIALLPQFDNWTE